MADYSSVALMTGLAQRLDGLGIGRVVVGPIVNEPDTVTGLQPYPLSDDIGSGQILLGVQVNMRDGKLAGVAGLLTRQETIYRSLVALQGVTVNGIAVVTAWRQSSAGPVGLDDQGRPRYADTYWMRTDRLGIQG